MRSDLPLLHNVRIAAPCNADWSAMTPVGEHGERVRHCALCHLNVYNLSALTQSEAEGLLRTHEGRLCVRYYQRADGTVLTQDCPIGDQMVQIRLAAKKRSAAMLVFVLIATGAFAAGPILSASNRGNRTMGDANVSQGSSIPTTGAPSFPSKASDANTPAKCATSNSRQQTVKLDEMKPESAKKANGDKQSDSNAPHPIQKTGQR